MEKIYSRKDLPLVNVALESAIVLLPSSGFRIDRVSPKPKPIAPAPVPASPEPQKKKWYKRH